MTDIRVQRVASGATLLDERLPGWAAKVPDTFDVSEADNCPLRWVYGSFYHGADVLFGEHRDEIIEYGFDLYYFDGQDDPTTDPTPDNVAALNAAWCDEIAKRI